MTKDESFEIFVEYVRWGETNGPTVEQTLEKIQADVRLNEYEKLHLAIRIGVAFADTMYNPKDN